MNSNDLVISLVVTMLACLQYIWPKRLALFLQPSWWPCSECAGPPFTWSGCCGAPSASGPTWCTAFMSVSTSFRASSSTSALQSIPSSTACSPHDSASVSENLCVPRRRTTPLLETPHPSLRFHWVPPSQVPEIRSKVRTPMQLSLCCLLTWA